jgi:cytochrome d ubiquinol oxidase subunit I
MAKRSMVVAASFGLASALSVVVLGDESGYVATEHQKMKIAAMEASYHTEPAPAPWTVFALPGPDGGAPSFSIQIPWVGGLITTRSFDEELQGIDELILHAETRIRSGMIAYDALEDIRADGQNGEARARFEQHWADLGYGLLLKKYRDDVQNATNEQIVMAAKDTVPDVWPLFWTFRIMMGLGFFFIAFFAVWFYRASKGWLDTNRPLLWIGFAVLPLPWVAIESGWFIAEYGRQPWVVEGVLPTFYAASGLQFWDLVISITFFVTLYSILLFIMIMLMVKIIKAGPQDDLLNATDEGDADDFVIAALPATPATKELGS